jgi:peroxiredoxin
MNLILLLLPWTLLGVGVWLGAVLIRQHGRMLLRLDAIERELVISRIAQPRESTETPGREPGDNIASLSKSKINRSGLKIGTPAPAFTLPHLDGVETTNVSDYAGRAFLLVFASPDCTPCETLLSRLAGLPSHVKRDQLLVVTRATDRPPHALARSQCGFPVLVQQAWEISRLYATFNLPSAYVVNADGVIVTEVMTGPDVICHAAHVLVGLTRTQPEQLKAAVLSAAV